ncbi:GH25 family lysozyme [Ligilactobacillus acidipiscis]|uniref:GH25 family lysozyme n=1 Tax=Ligilactobacillus acidipiscis TaxID=89059 RepID=UPI0023F9E031|nr:GH25 family lysozyme [Ligilactobacillus acidipiscis]WEV56549.1 GH25 family lysozyme [Ligilactobacillus acidipiscis]
MTAKFIDVASYQPDSLAYFQAARTLGVKGVVVKITEGSAAGSNYVNPKAAQQIKNARAAGLTVSGYHFLRSISVKDAQEEAQFFAREANNRGLGQQATIAIDVEAADLTRNVSALTAQVNAFATELSRLGFKKISIYSSTSWFKGRLLRNNLSSQIFWVASYGTKDAGIPCAAWQYSDKQLIAGARTDLSVDYSGTFTGNNETDNKEKKTPKVKDKWIDELGVTWYVEKGTFVSDRAIFLRWGAKTTSTKIVLLPAGSIIKYDAFAHSGGYIWIRQPRGNGQYGYLATGESSNNKRCSTWGNFK